MSRNLIVMVVMALSCWGLVFDDLASANHQPQQGRRSLTVTKSAMLQELHFTDGRLITDVYDGFALSYTTRSQKRSALATPKAMKGLRIMPEGVTVDGNTTTVVVRTSDNALEITSHFKFDQSGKRLMIQRVFRNVSTKPVALRAIRQFVDPELIREPAVNQPLTLVAGLASGLGECFIDSKCRVPPPPCPPECDFMVSAASKYSRPKLNSSRRRNTLSWSKQITLKPQQHNQPESGAAYIIVNLLLK